MNIFFTGSLFSLQHFWDKSFKPPDDLSFASKPYKLCVHQSLQVLVWISGGKPFLSLFFHLFRVQCSSINRVHSQGLITLVWVAHYFRVFLHSMKNFENRFFLITPLHKKAYKTICTIGTGMKNRRAGLFHNYLNQCHF